MANLKLESPPILPLTLSRLSPCLVSKIGRGVRCVFTCKKIVTIHVPCQIFILTADLLLKNQGKKGIFIT